MTFVVLLTFTREFSMYNQFLTVSIILALVAFVFLFLVRDPDIHKL